jgi:hypothetical protein
VRSADGDAFLHAHDLTLEIGDIDKELSRYESGQSFNLVDVCAFFFAGPLGLAVTKEYFGNDLNLLGRMATRALSFKLDKV